MPQNSFASNDEGRHWYFYFGSGEGRVRLSKTYQVGDSNFDIDSKVKNQIIGFGYILEQNTYLEFNYATDFVETAIDIFGLDEVSLSETQILLGHQLNFSKKWSIAPEVAFSKGALKIKESPLFNPGPEEEFSTDDYNVAVGANLKWRISPLFAINLKYTQVKFDYIDSHNTYINMTFHF